MLSAFSGLGGMDLGLEAAGFESLGCLEWDGDAQQSLKANRGDAWPLVGSGDVAVDGAGLTPRRLGLKKGELDLLAGAPPCQPFSKAAQWNSSARQGLADPRHDYIKPFFEIATRFAPKFILIENVQGYVQGPTSALPELERLTEELAKATRRSYAIQTTIVDAADYAVPQSRKRAIVVITYQRNFEWLLPIQERRTAWDAIGEPPEDQEIVPATGQWADLLATIPEGENYQWHTDRGGGYPLFGYRTRYWSFLQKLHRSRPAPTLAASPGPSTGPFHWDNRRLSIWEMLRLQTFPSDWRVEGDRRSQVKQIGNATPPLLAEQIGRKLAEALGVPPPSGDLQLSIPRSARPMGGLKTACKLPEKYLEQVGSHDPHPGAGMGPRPRVLATEEQQK
jgi:DNA (cytosine-5)-methyltransferase 1